MAYIKNGTVMIEFEDFLKTKMLREGTIKLYTDIISNFLKTRPDINNEKDYNDYIIEKSYRKNIYSANAALKQFIEFKIEDPNIKKNILKVLIKPKIKIPTVNRIKVTSEQINNVINSLTKDKHKLIAKIQRETGLRAADIFWLQSENILVEQHKDEIVFKLLIEEKGGKERIVYLFNKDVQKELSRYVNINSISHHPKSLITNNFDDYLFMKKILKTKKKTNLFTRMRTNYLYYWDDLKIALNSNNIKQQLWATHDFRRDFATRCYNLFDKDIYKLQQALNHARIETTVAYLRGSGELSIDLFRKMQQ